MPFSLADPELYEAADNNDPEALLEGVAMAGLVRQFGDLAQFAAEIFHGLHEEVMVTVSRGHGLLTRVQQTESDFRSVEKAFLSGTGHSAFFSRSGIRWHPKLQTEENLITKGDIPRFVMDSYEECRGPPRLFLLDKFDVAGACLKRYTDPSIYKVEASLYEMMNAEAQRDKKIRKIKKGSQWKNGDTHEVFQPSQIKLQQLLLEERVQNGASDPARGVKLKKRESKFPFDTETEKLYMEKILNPPSEDKLVHEVKMENSPLHLPTGSYEEPEVETFEIKMVNSPLDDIEGKHISVHGEHKDVIEDDNQVDDVASETDNYINALATMESEVETDAEFRAANFDPIIKQETSSDSATTSPNNMLPRGSNSLHAFASTEIPFRPRVLPAQIFDNCIEVSDNAGLLVDQETIVKENNCKESELSENCSNKYEDFSSPTKKEEIEIDPEDNMASDIVEDDNSTSTLVNSHVKEQHFVPSLDKLDICEDGLQLHVSPDVDFQSTTQFLDSEPDFADSAESQESKSSNLAPINMEMPPMPPLEWRMRKLQNPPLISPPAGSRHDIGYFPPVFPQTENHHSLNQNEIVTNEKSECDYEVKSQNVLTSGPEITSGDDEMPNDIRSMKSQRPRNPLIDAVVTDDKIKLRKVSQRAMPLFPKEEERDTFLEQIRAKSFNLKPAVKSRPVNPDPTTNLRVVAILEKANAIRQAFAGSDDDEDDNDNWSD